MHRCFQHPPFWSRCFSSFSFLYLWSRFYRCGLLLAYTWVVFQENREQKTWLSPERYDEFCIPNSLEYMIYELIWKCFASNVICYLDLTSFVTRLQFLSLLFLLFPISTIQRINQVKSQRSLLNTLDWVNFSCKSRQKTIISFPIRLQPHSMSNAFSNLRLILVI